MKRWVVSVFYLAHIQTEIITADTWQQAVYQHSHSAYFPSIEQAKQYAPDLPDDEAFKEASPLHVTWVEIPDCVKNAADRLRALSLLEDVRLVLSMPPAKLCELDHHRVTGWVSEAVDLLS